ncbi:unnamed protein product [Sphagnum jensenii]|uniref:Uncharacterized protein n=1 Tax=Sphagnum jensenii TaxID=128206 RepID=A0ABP1BST1_9BRYO
MMAMLHGESELSKKVLTVLPSDPYEQLEVARQITNLAVASKMSELESGTMKLQQTLVEKDQMISTLQEHVANIQTTLLETSAKLTLALNEQGKLNLEKTEMARQMKKLTCDVAKVCQ